MKYDDQFLNRRYQREEMKHYHNLGYSLWQSLIYVYLGFKEGVTYTHPWTK